MSKFQARFMKLRFRRPHATSEHGRDLLMLVALDVMQEEDEAVSGRQFPDCLFEGDAIEHRQRARPRDLAHVSLFGRLLQPNSLLAPPGGIHSRASLRTSRPQRPSGSPESRAAYYTYTPLKRQRLFNTPPKKCAPTTRKRVTPYAVSTTRSLPRNRRHSRLEIEGRDRPFR